MVTLSIVVPIYNTEKYLTKCIDSLLHQDMDDYEILLVNDSSPDNAQNIIDEYKQKFPAIIKSFIKENGGLGDTRNYAIPFAEGKYIMFVDSDDYIKENSLKKLCQMMEEKELDILVYDFIKVYDNRQFIHEKSMHSVSTEEYIMSTPNACNKIFNKDIFIRHGITFPTDICGTPVTTTGGTYAKAMPGIVPFGPSFPGQKGIGHNPNEWMTTADLVMNAKIYALALYRLAVL